MATQITEAKNMSSEKPAITQHPGVDGQGYDNIALQPVYQPQQVGQVAQGQIEQKK